MGLLDLLKPNRQNKAAVEQTRSALEEARTPGGDEDTRVSQLIEKLLSLGIDGVGPLASAEKLGDRALVDKHGDREDAIDAVIWKHVRGGAGGGFLTSVGGFFTMLAAIPVNVFEFYVQATRMVASVAHLRGYDVTQPEVRTAVLLTLVGNDANQVLKAAGVPVGAVGGGKVAQLALGHLPKSALMVVNKAVGFRILRTAGEKVLSKFGKAIPVAGGVLGAGMDGYLMKQIANAAKREFPQI